MDRHFIAQISLAAACLVCGLSSCSSTSFSAFSFSKQSDSGLNKVDELLTRIEKVQVESLVAKERVHAAYASLQTTVAPDFHADAVEQHKALLKSIEDSEQQAKTLSESLPPLKNSASVVFERWTKDLESFGNTRMRQRSQERMEATREQYETLLRQSVAAQLAMEALNADLSDHALFLGHDFNSESAASIFDDVQALDARVVELDGRLNATIQSAKQYIASRALRGEVEKADEAQTEAPAAAKGQKRKLKQRPQPTDGADASGAGVAAAADGAH